MKNKKVATACWLVCSALLAGCDYFSTKGAGSMNAPMLREKAAKEFEILVEDDALATAGEVARGFNALLGRFSVTTTPERHYGVEGVSAKWSQVASANMDPLPKRVESVYPVELAMLVPEAEASRLGWGAAEPSIDDVARAAASGAWRFGLANPRADACAYSWVAALAAATLPAPQNQGAPIDYKEARAAEGAGKAAFGARSLSARSSSELAADFARQGSAAQPSAAIALVCEGEAAKAAAAGGKIRVVKLSGGMVGLAHSLVLENDAKEWMFDEVVAALRESEIQKKLGAALGAPHARAGAKNPRWPAYVGARDALLESFESSALERVDVAAVVDAEGRFKMGELIQNMADLPTELDARPEREREKNTITRQGSYEVSMVGAELRAPELVEVGGDPDPGRTKLFKLGKREKEREAELVNWESQDYTKKEDEILRKAGIGPGDMPMCTKDAPEPALVQGATGPAPILRAAREAYQRSIERSKRGGKSAEAKRSLVVYAGRNDESDPEGEQFEAWHRALPPADRRIPIDVVVPKWLARGQYERVAKITGGAVHVIKEDSMRRRPREPQGCHPWRNMQSADFTSLKTPEELEQLKRYEEHLKSQAGQGTPGR